MPEKSADVVPAQATRNPAEGKVLTVVVLIFIGFVFYLLDVSVATYRRYYTCAVCRETRVEKKFRLTGSVYNKVEESVCTKWYRENVEAEHEHVWGRSSTIGMLNYYGRIIGVGDNQDIPGRVIWRLTPEEQLDIYKNFEDPSKAKELFITLTKPESLENKADYSVLHSLRDWADSGFAEEWKPPTDWPPAALSGEEKEEK